MDPQSIRADADGVWAPIHSPGRNGRPLALRHRPAEGKRIEAIPRSFRMARCDDAYDCAALIPWLPALPSSWHRRRMLTLQLRDVSQAARPGRAWRT